MSARKPVVSLQNRLKHLESLVKDAMTAQNPAAKGAFSNSHDTPNGSGSASSGNLHSRLTIHGQRIRPKGNKLPRLVKYFLAKDKHRSEQLIGRLYSKT
jgi:hypothetical protein